MPGRGLGRDSAKNKILEGIPMRFFLRSLALLAILNSVPAFAAVRHGQAADAGTACCHSSDAAAQDGSCGMGEGCSCEGGSCGTDEGCSCEGGSCGTDEGCSCESGSCGTDEGCSCEG